jgi:hypothetical protein
MPSFDPTTASTAQLRGARLVAASVVAVGLVVLAIGIAKWRAVPPQPPRPSDDGFMEGRIAMDEIRRRSDEWFEGVRRHHDAEFSAHGWMLAGGLVAFGGALALAQTTRAVRRTANALLSERAAAVATGVRVAVEAGPAAPATRLAQLEDLRQRGLISEDEYREKRAAILESV